MSFSQGRLENLANQAAFLEDRRMSAEDLPSSLPPTDTAHVTLHAHGNVGANGVCQVECCKGADSIFGRNERSVCAGDTLLEALVGCVGVTLGQMAMAMEIDLRRAAIHAEGDLDVRELLGMSENAPMNLQNIRLHFDVESNATDEQLSVLVNLTERYCVVSRTLDPPATITFSSSRPSDSAK